MKRRGREYDKVGKELGKEGWQLEGGGAIPYIGICGIKGYGFEPFWSASLKMGTGIKSMLEAKSEKG